MLCLLHRLRLDITTDNKCPICELENRALYDAGYTNKDIAEWHRLLIEDLEPRYLIFPAIIIAGL